MSLDGRLGGGFGRLVPGRDPKIVCGGGFGQLLPGRDPKKMVGSGFGWLVPGRDPRKVVVVRNYRTGQLMGLQSCC